MSRSSGGVLRPYGRSGESPSGRGKVPARATSAPGRSAGLTPNEMVQAAGSVPTRRRPTQPPPAPARPRPRGRAAGRPPALWSRFPGCAWRRKAVPSVNGHCPISGELVLPTMTATAARSLANPSAVRSAGGIARAPERGRLAGHVDVVLDRDRHPSSGNRSPAASRRSASTASASRRPDDG